MTELTSELGVSKLEINGYCKSSRVAVKKRTAGKADISRYTCVCRDNWCSNFRSSPFAAGRGESPSGVRGEGSWESLNSFPITGIFVEYFIIARS